MQFNFDCEEILDCNQNGYSILEGACHNNIPPGYKAYIKEILDKMGELSSKSQNLLVNVTTTNRFFPSDHTLIIKADKNKVLGYIKVGPKRLFLRDRICNYHERKTLCVLDFYIYDTEQRKGLGKEIFDFMLNYKKINPGELAYDRPTLRFLAFLKRNYGLENYIQQENNFTIYDEFFESERNKNNETQYDSDTHRVIQNLYTPRYLNRSVDFNSNNKYITNINPNYNNNNYRNSPQNNQRNMNIKKNYYLTETDNYQRTSMSPIGKQLIYNNDMIDNKRNNYQKYYNSNQRMNQYNERNNDIRYNITNRYNEDNQNQIYNKRYNNEDFNYDNRNQEYDYNQQNNNNQRLQNTINKGRFSPNQMSKSMQAYENNYNNNQNNYGGGRRRLKYDYDDY
jgi:alpha-tubulin N-acetyltransferase 1